MNKKKQKKRSAHLSAASGSPVRLSQCMIVKNEEKNIEQALSWAKDIAFEQIVVDTGSTDRTVEIAEKMGAKIYHFKWQNDFSAAKNHAIEQATGNWIAFLDADEYFSPEDAKKLFSRLKEIENNKHKYINTIVIKTPIYQLNDDGEISSIDEQTRIFRNNEKTRYFGRIHEELLIYGEVTDYNDISVIHTGYAETVYRENNKIQRNEKILREELALKPNDIKIKGYLADTLQSKMVLENYSNTEDIAEVDVLFKEVAESIDSVPDILKIKAYKYLLSKILNNPEKYDECRELCSKAYNEYPDNLDFCYFYAGMLNIKSEYENAWKILKKAEKLSDTNVKNNTVPVGSASTPAAIHSQLLLAAQGLGDIENTLKYAELLLESDKTNQNILNPYIQKLLNKGLPEDKVLERLGRVYDIKAPADLMLIAKAAVAGGAIDFAKMIMTITGELMG